MNTVIYVTEPACHRAFCLTRLILVIFVLSFMLSTILPPEELLQVVLYRFFF